MIHNLHHFNYQFEFVRESIVFSSDNFISLLAIYHNGNLFHQFQSTDGRPKRRINSRSLEQLNVLIQLTLQVTGISFELKYTPDTISLEKIVINGNGGEQLTWKKFLEDFADCEENWLDIIRFSYRLKMSREMEE